MTQFAPHWILKADSDIINEGQKIMVRLSINKEKLSDPDEYILDDDQYLELVYRISGAGETFEDRDFKVQVGTDISSLVPIQDADTSNNNISGTHTVQLTKKKYELINKLSSDEYFIEVYCDIDGVWDGPEQISIQIISLNEITITSGQISNVEASGEIDTGTATIQYDYSTEIWVTPSLTTRDDEMYSIGEIHYGSDSRLFVQAYGKKRAFNYTIDSDPDDVSPRVFYPMYEMLTIDSSQLPSQNRTGHGTIIVPNPNSTFPTPDEEMPLVIQDELGNMISSGLKFNGNGQILSTFLYESDPIDGYFKTRIVSPTSYYNTPKDAFYSGKRFKAYQMWVCPEDTTYIKGAAKPNHLYQLKNTLVYPYVIKEEYVSNVQMAVFEENDWIDLGYFDERLGDGLIGKERTFRVIVNAATGDGIDFITDSNLGAIHVGEYFGHTVYPVIRAVGTLVTYELSPTSRDNIRKYNLDLAADGTLVGTAYARAQDFSANDEIKLEFDVTATDKSGASITGTFKLRIIRGFGQNFLSAYVHPSVPFERKWFSTISTPNFYNQNYYRAVDDRYGLQKTPRMLLKENFVSQNYQYTTLENMKKLLRENIINPEHGAPVPDGIFGFVMGNYKIRSALDKLGNVLYDVLYREIHPGGTSVEVSMNPQKYTIQDISFLSEFFGLRENIYRVVGEDTTNLLSDPDDLQARSIVVPPIQGISQEMLDTVPRYMNHPYLEEGVKAEFMPVIPVAYFMPGQAEAFFTKLVQSNEHKSLVNEYFEVGYVEFQYFFQNYELYVQDNYTIQIKEQSRLGS